MLLLALVPPLAARADDGEDKTTWAVAPASAEGPDGRRVMELEADPGERIDEHLAVTNLSTREVTFKVRAADGYFNEKGRFNTIASDRESVEAGTWMTVPEEVTIPAKGTVVLPLTIEVPVDAEPGDHAAGVSASITQKSTDASGSTVGVESRVGFRVTVSVTGEVRPSASVSGVEGAYATNWNPIRPGSATVRFTVTNDGNARFSAVGVVSLGGSEVAFPAEGQPRQELLPGDSREFLIEVPGVVPTFIVGGSVELTPQGVGERAEGLEFPTVTASADLLAVPWPQLAVGLGLLLIVLALLFKRGRDKARIADLITRAREEGRRAAQEEGK